jgi:threonine-phosphate decarboxylase
MTESAHGGDIYTFAKRLGISPDEVIDFSSNINCYAPKIEKDFNKLNIRNYADPTYSDLKSALSQKYGVRTGQIALFNGASSAIATLLGMFSHVTIYAPAYSEYRRYAQTTTLINRFDDLYALPPKGSLVVFVNPSTPEGDYYALNTLFEIWKARECTVLIDESFLEFTEFDSALSFLQSYPKLYILKSMTKFYACAGVRVGVVLSTPENIRRLEEKIPMWNISTYDSVYIQEALKDTGFLQDAMFRIKQDKKLLYWLLIRSGYIRKVYPSDVNFFLVKLNGIDAYRLQEMCDRKHILIRNCENFDFLDRFHVRFAVRTKEDIVKLKEVLDA